MGKTFIPIGWRGMANIQSGQRPSNHLIHSLAHKGIHFLSQCIREWSFDAPIFQSARQLGLQAVAAVEWDAIRDVLRGAGFCYAPGGDYISWKGPMKHNAIIVKDVYRDIIHRNAGAVSLDFISFWSWKLPTKITIFGWLVWMGKVLTWENLLKRGHQGPGRCALCCNAEENITHLFFTCPITRQLWGIFSDYHMDSQWMPQDFLSAANDWGKLHSKFYVLPFFLIWEVWKARNRLIFEGVPFRIDKIFTAIHRWIDERPTLMDKETDCSHRLRPHDISLPAIFFDGASEDNSTGCGVWIKLSANERIHLFWNGGPGSNNKAELMALWGGLWVASDLSLKDINIYGDSKTVIGWVTNRFQFLSPHLRGWLDRTQSLWNRMQCPRISHIYRENNTRADGLSKRGLRADFGVFQVYWYRNGRKIQDFNIPLP